MILSGPASGVDSKTLGTWKQMAIGAAAETRELWSHHPRCHEECFSRGETGFVHFNGHQYSVMVTEGLGTWNLIGEDADLRAHHQKTYYHECGISNFMMAANDLACVGGRPVVYVMHVAIGAEDYLNGQNGRDLLDGTVAACKLTRCIYGGGESPVLKGIIPPTTMALSGSMQGICVKKKHLINSERLCAGARIIFVGSSGPHSNGGSRVRKLVDSGVLADRYLTRLPDGRTFGESLIVPTQYYGDLIFECQERGVDFLSASPITGDGFAKIMRAKQNFTYFLNEIQKPHAVFDFIRQQAGMSDLEMYTAFNMGTGLALYVMPKYVNLVLEMCAGMGLPAIEAGSVEEGPKQVIIKPLDNLVIDEDKLHVR